MAALQYVLDNNSGQFTHTLHHYTAMLSPSILWSLLAVALAFQLLPCSAKLVFYDNTRPMLDTEGRILDAHDGTIQRFHDDGPYYMHAVEYGLCQVRVLERLCECVRGWSRPGTARSKGKACGKVNVLRRTPPNPTRDPHITATLHRLRM